MSFRPILSAVGTLYGYGANFRNYLYERGIFRSLDLGCRTISIGNLTAGGTGKTPLVAYVADLLTQKGEKICILTRGYGRESPGERVLVSDGESVLVDARTGGDEPVELANKLQGKAVIIADADRVSAASWARENFDVTTFILDDGFQHRRAKRDLDIVLIDATNPFGGGMLPLGTLREPIANIERADAVVISRSDLIDSTDEILSEIRSLNANAKIFTAKNSVVNISQLRNQKIIPNIPHKAFAFCGLGNPQAFFELLKRNGFKTTGEKAFPDHHFYTQNEMDEIVQKAKNTGAECLMTTAKDAVKLSNRASNEIPVYVVEIETTIAPPDDFRKLVSGIL